MVFVNLVLFSKGRSGWRGVQVGWPVCPVLYSFWYVRTEVATPALGCQFLLAVSAQHAWWTVPFYWQQFKGLLKRLRSGKAGVTAEVSLVLMKSKSLSWASHDCLRRWVSKAVRFSIIWHSVTRFSEKYLNLLEKGKVDFQAGSLTNNLFGGSDPGLAYAFSSLHEKDSTSHAIFHLGCPMNLWLSIHVVGSAVCSSIRYQKNIWFCSHNKITAYLSF